ncbi:MAG: hypothetical protein E7576_06765 [Ruminococcaceae bacterium]|nr:hypothetical protein [Oscillospiraceae bacterium]
MKYYTTNRPISSRAKDIMTRILFVLIAAAVITFSAILIGQHLLRKAEAAGNRPSDTSGAGWSPEKTRKDPENTAGSAPTVRGCGIDPLGYETAEELDAALLSASVSYDTILFPLSGSDGSLIYQSPAVCALARIPVTDRAPAEGIQSAFRAAKMRGLRVIVSVTPSEAVTDTALYQELASWGADEILVTPHFSGAIDYESANLLRLYLIECSADLTPSCRLGTVLPADSYLDSSGAMQLQMIAQVSASLGIRFDVQYMDPDADVFENMYNALQSLMGSFSVYNMRVIIDGTDPDLLAAQYRACAKRNIMNFIFTSAADYASFPVDEEEEPETEPVPEVYRPEQPAGVINPYANTSDTYNAEPSPEEVQTDPWSDYSWQNSTREDNSWQENTTWEDNSWQDNSTWEDNSWQDNSTSEDNSWQDNSTSEDNSWQENTTWEDNSWQDNSTWEDNSWQDNSTWEDNSWQDNSTWEDNSWQENTTWEDNSWQDNSTWEDNSWQQNTWEDNSWQQNSWEDNSSQGSTGEWWDSGEGGEGWMSWNGNG